MGQKCQTPASCASDSSKVKKNRRNRENFAANQFTDDLWTSYLQSKNGKKHVASGWIKQASVISTPVDNPAGETKNTAATTHHVKNAATNMKNDLSSSMANGKENIMSMFGRGKKRTKFAPLPLPTGYKPMTRKVWGKEVICVRRRAGRTQQHAMV